MNVKIIGKLLGKLAAKYNAEIEYTASNGRGIVGFRQKKETMSNYEFATKLNEELEPRGWGGGMWTDTFGKRMFILVNWNCIFTKD